MNRTVLVLDDSPIVLETLRARLGTHGFRVLTAENLAQLEAECANAKPDVFVLDVQMPEAFGDDVGQVLRAMRNVEAPILLFSSLDDAALEARTRDAGLDGWVSKRAGVPALVARIEEVLGRPRAPTP